MIIYSVVLVILWWIELEYKDYIGDR